MPSNIILFTKLQQSKVCVRVSVRVCARACVCVMYRVFPILRWACVHEREKKKNPTPNPPELSHIRTVAAFPPTPGWLWHCEQAADPPSNQNILYLGAISPHLA